jgi:phosphopantothenoylcysteine decarboxylase/phosphopantothenate--cysteine ligase
MVPRAVAGRVADRPPGGARRLLLIIGGGIAAYKCLELIRRGRERGYELRCVMTRAAEHFVTPLSVASLNGDKVFDELFSLTDEAEMGHIRLSREADLVLVAPATADLMAKMAQGHADDLASAILLATDKPVLVAPAMNPQMWAHPATRRNLERLRADGVGFVDPAAGDMACGEVGTGRMAEPAAILAAIDRFFTPVPGPLTGLGALVTSGPTHEALDPVRYLANRSSGRQGHAIAEALAQAGAQVTLVTGPVQEPDPASVAVVRVISAREMLAASLAALPVDLAVCAAAVADWRPEQVGERKMKKEGDAPPTIRLVENPDILMTLATRSEARPRLVIGFAAETGDLERQAAAKLKRKGCDWILANDVGPGTNIFGGIENSVTLLRKDGRVEGWPTLAKREVAARLVREIVAEIHGRASS